MARLKNLIPSFLTCLNLILGFVTIVLGEPEIGSYLIMVGMLLDVSDGLLARLLDAKSAIGKELDSLADMVTFGVAPAYLYYLLAPSSDMYLLAGPIAYVVGACLRLAIFNTLPPSDTFRGLASPFAAFFMVGIFLGYSQNNEIVMQLLLSPMIYISVGIVLAILMLMPMKMFSAKGIGRRLPLPILALMMVAAAALYVDAWIAPAIIVLSYIAISWIATLSTQKTSK